MKLVVAVSGGVDSVVLLHKLVRAGEKELVVAHFDHGIRPESDADARFVGKLAESYNLPFEWRREELGPQASEAHARDRRYYFLRELAAKHAAAIATAHHADDVVETLAINLHRGTGWRGLPILDTPGIERPLVGHTKQEIYEYALRHGLEWVEDETNATPAYLRNRLRAKLHRALTKAEKEQLLELWDRQKQLKRHVDREVGTHLNENDVYSRYFFTHIDEAVAAELLRAIVKGQATRPQLERGLHAIKTARPGSLVDIGAGIKLRFTRTDFIAEIPR